MHVHTDEASSLRSGRPQEGAEAFLRSSSWRTRRRTLPIRVSGSSSRNSHSLGTRYPVSPCAGSRAHASSSSPGDGLALLRHDVGLHPLARPVVGQSHDARLQHLRVPVDHRLDLGRVHVEAGHDDHVLHPVDDLEEPLVVHDRDVAGVQPFAPDHLRGRLGLVPIAEHHLGSLDAELAPLTLWHLAVRILERDDPTVGVGDGQADRPVLRLVERVHVRHGRGLGEPVALDEVRTARHLVELLGDRAGKRRRAGDAGLHRLQVVLRGLRRLVQGDEQPGDAGEERRLLLVQLLERHVDLEARKQDELARLRDPEVHRHQPERVEERQDAHHAVLAALEERDARHDLADVRGDVEVREHRALRQAGRPTRVDERRHVVLGVDLGHRRRRTRRPHRLLPPSDLRIRGDRGPRLPLVLRVLLELDGCEQVEREPHVVRELGDDHLSDGDLVLHGRPRRVELVEDDHHAGRVVLDLVRELALRVERVVTDRHGAEPLARVPRDHVLG